MGISITGGVKVPQGKFKVYVAPAVVGAQLWIWGKNDVGQLGLEDTVNRSSPVQVGSLTDWSSTSSGLSHSLTVKTDNTIWTWGRNDRTWFVKGEIPQCRSILF